MIAGAHPTSVIACWLRRRKRGSVRDWRIGGGVCCYDAGRSWSRGTSRATRLCAPDENAIALERDSSPVSKGRLGSVEGVIAGLGIV